MDKLSNIAQFTVTQLNNSIKNLIENSYQVIKISGEICQVNKHSSGHIYFSLKDEESIISVIAWRSIVPRLKFNIDNGFKVLVSGRVTTYEKQSKYQIIVQNIELEGEGSLLKILDDRKKKLSSLGFFDVEKKKPLPKFPNSIGVITSQSGAVLKDIIHRISDRFPINLKLFPANVQGKKCMHDVIEGLDYFNKIEEKVNCVDIIIIARGGGSLEDLMPFNEELLIRKISESRIPVISAVGHETDFTLCDLVSDLRAPTPSTAAELAVPDRKEIILRLNDWSISLNKSFISNFDKKSLNLKLVISRIPDLNEKINNCFQNLDFFDQKLSSLLSEKLQSVKIILFELLKKFTPKVFENYIYLYSNQIINDFGIIKKIAYQNLKDSFDKISFSEKQLSLLSYKQTLKRGFAVVRQKNKVVKNDLEISTDIDFEIEFFNNKIIARKK